MAVAGFSGRDEGCRWQIEVTERRRLERRCLINIPYDAAAAGAWGEGVC